MVPGFSHLQRVLLYIFWPAFPSILCDFPKHLLLVSAFFVPLSYLSLELYWQGEVPRCWSQVCLIITVKLGAQNVKALLSLLLKSNKLNPYSKCNFFLFYAVYIKGIFILLNPERSSSENIVREMLDMYPLFHLKRKQSESENSSMLTIVCLNDEGYKYFKLLFANFAQHYVQNWKILFNI